MPRDFYFSTVKAILDDSLPYLCKALNCGEEQAFLRVRERLELMRKEWFKKDPKIDYSDPTNRFAYTYFNVAIQGAICEQSLRMEPGLFGHVLDRARSSLSVCSVGGGPGSELLGITNLLLDTAVTVGDVELLVLDRVPTWVESYRSLSSVCRKSLRSKFGTANISHPFSIMDAFDPTSYKDYVQQFASMDVFIFNYVFSENYARTNGLRPMIDHLVANARPGCYFVVADRRQGNRELYDSVRSAFKHGLLTKVLDVRIAGEVDGGYSGLGRYHGAIGQPSPRKTFRWEDSGQGKVFGLVYRKSDQS